MPIDIHNDDLPTAINKLKARETIFNQLESISKIGSWEVDLKTKKSIWSDQSYKIYGLDKETTEPTFELFLSKLIPSDLQKAQITLAKAMQDGKPTTFQSQIIRADGKIIDILLNGQVIYDENKTPYKLIGSTQDITEQVNAKREAEEFKELVQYSSNEIYILNYDTLKYLYVNDGAIKKLGYSYDEFLKMSVLDINPKLKTSHIDMLKVMGERDGQVLNRTIHQKKDGSTYHAQSLIHRTTYKNQDAFIIFDTDITKQIEDEKLLEEQAQKLNHQANHDILTNLPNRMLLKDRLEQAISYSSRHNESFALLFIDLDQFKKINDLLGHHVGDDVLIEASSRLFASIREEDTLARFGGDEFIIILRECRDIQSAASVAQKIIFAMKEPIEINEHTLFISSSIGISMFPQDATNEEDLVKFADTAMYRAKDEGRDNFQFYSEDMTTQAFQRVALESSLRVAVKEEQFVVYFQPQYNVLSKTITGMEALVRWQHPELGLVPPAKFIPIAEESRLIIDIDSFVMKSAMQQFCKWYKDGYNPGVLSLNLSMKQLDDSEFIPTLLNIMNSMQFQAKWLELEVTETQVMSNPDSSIIKLQKISDLGIQLAIDDFGTGYSSLAYLKKLPLNKLKIDRSFVKDIPHDEDDIAITKAIIALGESLNLKLIAEGVETLEQNDFLIKNRCNNIQGFLYSKPIPADDITKLLKEGL